MKNQTHLSERGKAGLFIAAIIFSLTLAFTFCTGQNLAEKVLKEAKKYDVAVAEYKNTKRDRLTAFAEVKKTEIDLAVSKIIFFRADAEKESKRFPDYNAERYNNAKREVKRLLGKIGLPYIAEYLIPTDLFYVFLKDDNVYITQTARQHFANNGLLAVDIGTHGKSLPIYAPDFQNEEVKWEIKKIDYPKSTGHTLILTNKKLGARWIIGHVHYLDEYPKNVETGDSIGFSGGVGEHQGVSTGAHAHLEFFTRTGGKWLAADYTLLNSNHHERWNFTPDKKLFGTEKEVKIYASGYNAGDPNQNDASPCIAASGRNICEMLKNGEHPIALTSDIRNLLGVKFGDKVKVECDDGREFLGSVEDEMNSRFRSECITSPLSRGFCIKSDIAFSLGEEVKGCVATIRKL